MRTRLHYHLHDVLFVNIYEEDHGPGSDQTFFILVLFCFVFFRGKPKKKFWNSHNKGLLHRASNLLITSCSYQSYLSLSCCYENGDHCCTVFSTSNRSFQYCFFFREIEVRLLFVHAFVFAERRLKKPQYIQGLQSPIYRKCGMTSLSLNNLIGMDRYQERISA